MKSALKKLTDASLEKQLQKLPDWELNAKKTELSRTISCHTFVDALAYAARVAVHAEIIKHHPVLELSESKLKIKLTTSELKGISNLDIELARRISSFLERLN